MKSAFGFLVTVLAATSALAQGTVNFANTSTSLITTQSFFPNNGPMSGVNAYRIGLYVGPLGAPWSALTLAGIATNSPFAGRFNGNPSDGFFQVLGHDTGEQITFQIRAWSLAAGATFHEALANRFALLGVSPLGVTTLGGGIVLPGRLFGDTTPDANGNFGVPGFVIGQVIPEPTTHSLAVIRAIVLFLRRGWRSRQKSN